MSPLTRFQSPQTASSIEEEAIIWGAVPFAPPTGCWGEVYTEEVCCDLRYGFQGNSRCWGEIGFFYNFERCCVTGRAAVTRVRELLRRFASGGSGPHFQEAVDSLARASAIAPSWPDVQFDISVLRARSGLPPREHPQDTCTTEQPLVRLVQGIAVWPHARLGVPHLLCVVYTAARAHKVYAQWETWGRKCDRFVVATDRPWPRRRASRDEYAFRKTLPFELLSLQPRGNAIRGYSELWQRVRTIWLELLGGMKSTLQRVRLPKNNVSVTEKFVKGDFDDWNWTYICGDDTFVLVENLRKELLRQESMNSVHRPLYVGQPLLHTEHGAEGLLFNSGGAGYALNRPAASLLRSAILSDPTCGAGCGEDVMVATCLAKHGVWPSDTKHPDGFARFQPFSVDYFWNVDQRRGLTCCAEDTVSFHDIGPLYMMALWSVLYLCRDAAGTEAALRAAWCRLQPTGTDFIP